ncbi:zinc finger BED domain-containing protein isoform X2 [Danio aesculapii]|uniref:zinc finger BED domain-containing protein isoform X2 n=1 Tax=Danio aesculapii TaxID=1142201 RepID=UPI0024BFC9D7|nr:zinc finger BED domain-containing protein isoform X2 [Danio aesculapii]
MRENFTQRRLPSRIRQSVSQYSKSTRSKMATRKRSIVWSFFQAEDDRRVLCLLCMKTVLYFGHTTNMLRHLRTKHPSDFSSLDKRKPATDAVSKRNDSGCVEVTVLMDEQQVEVESVGEDGEMDGAIKGILRAAAGEGAKWSEGVRILERERELTEALRRVQQEEGRSIQLQKELLQQFREMDAERRVLQNQKCEQEQEHARLRKEREDLQQEKSEVQREREEIQKEREEFQKEKEELEKQKQELDTWKNSHAQGQTSGFYSC